MYFAIFISSFLFHFLTKFHWQLVSAMPESLLSQATCNLLLKWLNLFRSLKISMIILIRWCEFELLLREHIHWKNINFSLEFSILQYEVSELTLPSLLAEHRRNWISNQNRYKDRLQLLERFCQSRLFPWDLQANRKSKNCLLDLIHEWDSIGYLHRWISNSSEAQQMFDYRLSLSLVPLLLKIYWMLLRILPILDQFFVRVFLSSAEVDSLVCLQNHRNISLEWLCFGAIFLSIPNVERF